MDYKLYKAPSFWLLLELKLTFNSDDTGRAKIPLRGLLRLSAYNACTFTGNTLALLVTIVAPASGWLQLRNWSSRLGLAAMRRIASTTCAVRGSRGC